MPSPAKPARDSPAKPFVGAGDESAEVVYHMPVLLNLTVGSRLRLEWLLPSRPNCEVTRGGKKLDDTALGRAASSQRDAWPTAPVPMITPFMPSSLRRRCGDLQRHPVGQLHARSIAEVTAMPRHRRIRFPGVGVTCLCIEHKGRSSRSLVIGDHPFMRRIVIEWRNREAGCVLIATCAIFPVASLYVRCTSSAVVPALTLRPLASVGEMSAAAISW